MKYNRPLSHTLLPLATLAACIVLGACTSPAPASPSSSSVPPSSAPTQSAGSQASFPLTDSLGNTLSVPAAPKVVSLYASYADAWLLAGGSLIGATSDAVAERKLPLGDEVTILGTVKEPSAEAIIALNPDLVLLNADIAAQVELETLLHNAGLTVAYFRTDTFEEYAQMMEQFCAITGRSDLFQKNVTAVGQQIKEVKDKIVVADTTPSVLLMRAFSSGIKAKSEEELAGQILKELMASNICDANPSMLEDLSLEEVITSDPDFIFVTTMGDEQKALDYLQEQIDQNPAWSSLTAVKEGRYIVLPKDLFHYKPNSRWEESYAYLAKLLYPTLFPDA